MTLNLNTYLTEKTAFQRALSGKANNQAPWWMMRQAGRYLPEYRALRAKAKHFLDFCYTPDLAVEATLQPLRRYDMSAAILFSDILVVPDAMGQEVGFFEGEGPRLGTLDPQSLFFDPIKLAPVYQAVSRIRQELDKNKSLIGFAGAPFTVACYMVDGKGGGFLKTRALVQDDPAFLEKLIIQVTEATIGHLSLQIENGVDAVQLFDSWAGALTNEKDFIRFSVEPARAIVSALRTKYPHIPIIGFPRGAGDFYPLYAKETGISALGVDQGMDIALLAKQVPEELCLQGNLDPVLLIEGGDRLLQAARYILSAMQGRPFIFNLGHGIDKTTPLDHVSMLADLLNERKS